VSRIGVRQGDVLVFTWDGPEPEADEVFAALGAAGDAGKLDIFPASKIAPVGLDVFLAEGHGVATGDLTASKAELHALTGIIVIVPARAFEGHRATLEVTAPLVHVATFREAAADPAPPLPIETESAKGTLGGAPGRPAKSDARIGGMVAMAVLLFLAAFVVLFVLMAG